MKILPRVVLLLSSTTLLAQTKPQIFSKVYVGTDGLACRRCGWKRSRRVQGEGPGRSQRPETIPRQVGSCTRTISAPYSIPIGLVVYRGGKTLLLGDGLMIYDWCFVGQDEQIAMSTGSIHGMESRHLILYDTASGRQRKEWRGPENANPLTWAKGLEQ